MDESDIIENRKQGNFAYDFNYKMYQQLVFINNDGISYCEPTLLNIAKYYKFHIDNNNVFYSETGDNRFNLYGLNPNNPECIEKYESDISNDFIDTGDVNKLSQKVQKGEKIGKSTEKIY